jgi:hypothetical protein
MTDGDDFNRVIAFQIEEDAVVAATETEAGKRSLPFFSEQLFVRSAAH